jgi:hypothetical protein
MWLLDLQPRALQTLEPDFASIWALHENVIHVVFLLQEREACRRSILQAVSESPMILESDIW